MVPVKFTSKPVLTIDIVEFSELSQTEQVIATQVLFELLRRAFPVDENNDDRRVWSPAGDGGCLTFWYDNVLPITMAVTLGKLVKKYNRYINGKIKSEDVDSGIQDKEDVDPGIHGRDVLPKTKKALAIRTGIHFGAVVRKADFDKRMNIWGNGINLSARVANLAKPNQIVISRQYYREADLEHEYPPGYDIRFIGTWWAKHDKSLELYNVYVEEDGEKIGIPWTEVEEWYTTFHQPLEKVIRTYVKMLEDEKRAYRALILAKRILDLCPDEEQLEHKSSTVVIKKISQAGRHGREPGKDALYDTFFSHLSVESLLYFCRHTRFTSFKKGSYIFRQGEDAHSMMLVVSGEIELFINENRVLKTLKEGNIIGEMGLFNPAGRKRTASLRTIKNAITLSFDYAALELKRSSLSLESRQGIEKFFGPRFLRYEDNLIVEELREQIWMLYSEHTRENQILVIHPLFQGLEEEQRQYLVEHSEMLPKHYNSDIALNPDDIWDYLNLIVEGSIIVRTKQGKVLPFGKGDCVGTVRLSVDKLPYDKVDIAPNTHLVRIPWKEVKIFLQERGRSYSKEFHQTCSFEAIKIRERFREEGENYHE